MYFLSDLEHKRLINQILPTARQAGVSLELRGWSWHQEPLKPYYEDVRLPMYAVCSKYCPTGRDVYLTQVEKIRGIPTFKIALGKVIHGVVSDYLQAFIQRHNLSFEQWWQKVRWKEISIEPERIIKPSKAVWEYVAKQCEARYVDAQARQPYASEHSLIASTAPFLIEHKVSGELLGLSGLISPDCYDYLRCIMFDLKVEDSAEDWHRLAPVGYSLVFESVYEVPVDVCGVVYLNLMDDKVVIKKDIFFVSDELRRWWIEERDRKLEIVAERKDPGKPSDPSQCTPDCMYHRVCYE